MLQRVMKDDLVWKVVKRHLLSGVDVKWAHAGAIVLAMRVMQCVVSHTVEVSWKNLLWVYVRVVRCVLGGGSCSMRTSMRRASAIICRPVGLYCFATFKEPIRIESGAAYIVVSSVVGDIVVGVVG